MNYYRTGRPQGLPVFFVQSSRISAGVRMIIQYASVNLAKMHRHRFIALLLLALVSIKTLMVPFVYLDFELRKDYIVQNLCENRFKPQLHCNGQCYLAKTLAKIAEEKAHNAAEKQGQNIKKVLEEVFEEVPCSPHSLPLAFTYSPPSFFYQPAALADFEASLLRPPSFV